MFDNLRSNTKLFTDDTSMSSVVHEVNISAKELKDDFKNSKKLMLGVCNGKSFNPDQSKQPHEIIFNC